MVHRFLFLVLVVCCAMSAYADAAATAGQAPFAAGLPDFPPLKNAVTSRPRTATLPSTSDGTFEVVTGENKDGDVVWWLLHRKPDGPSTLQRLTMDIAPAGMLTTTARLTLDPTSNATAKLAVGVPHAGDVLLYWWLPGDAATITVGQPLPDFTLRKHGGGTLRLADLKGSIVVVNSWATWCAPCVEEMPSLNRLVKRFAGRGVEFVAILEPDQSSDLTAFLKKRPFAYQQTLATNSSRPILGSTYPRHVILGADGKVAYARAGGSPKIEGELSRALDRLLRQKK